LDWKTFEERPQFNDFIVVENKYKKAGYFQGIEDFPCSESDGQIGVNNGMPVYHTGKHVWLGYSSAPITETTKWIKI